MKRISLTLVTMFISLNVMALSENTIKRIEEACVCQLEAPEFSTGANASQMSTGSITFTKKAGFKDCIAESIFLAEEIYADPTNTDSEKKKAKDYEKSLKKSAKSDSSPICERQAVKEWYKKMKYGLKNKPDVFKALVDQAYCDAEYCEYASDGTKNKITINIGMPQLGSGVKLCNVDRKTPIAKVKVCREALGKLAVETKDSIAKSCEVDLRKLSSRKALTNKCVELNTYKTVYLSKYELFEKHYCIAEGVVTDKGDYSSILDQERDCRLLIQPIQSKIFTQAASKDEKYKECADDTYYITDQAKSVCKSLLINKVLGFHSDKEKLGLYACIMNRDEAKMNTALNTHYSAAGQKEYIKKFDGNSVEECFKKYLGGGNADEEKKLQEIADKFCATELTETGKKECLKQVLALYGEDLDVEKCNTIEEETEKQKCIRELLYDKILASEADAYSRCWDVSMYPDATARKKCLDSVKEFNDIVKKCYPDDKATFTHEVNECIFSKLDPDNFEHLTRFGELLNSVAQKANPDKYKKCKENELDWVCLGYVADKDESKDKPYEGMYAAGYCVDQSPAFDQCLEDYWKKTYTDLGMSYPSGDPLKPGDPGYVDPTLAGKGNVGDVNVNGLKAVTEGGKPKTTGTNSNALGIGGVVLAADGGATITGKGGGSIDPMSLTGNNDEVRKKQFFGILRDFKYIGIRGKEAPCSSLRKAAWVRVGSLVAGLGAMTFAGIKAAKHIKEGKKENKGQKASWEATGMILGATAGALGLRALGNMWAKSIVEKARTQELTRLSNPGPPPPREIRCQKGTGSKKKSAFYDIKLFKNISKGTVSNIKAAKSHHQVNALFNEWEGFAFGESIYTAGISEKELDALFEPDESEIPLAMLKKTLIASVQGVAGIIIPNAMAEEKSGGVDIMSMLPQIISMASSAGVFDGKKEDETVTGSKDVGGKTVNSDKNGTASRMNSTQSRSIAKSVNKKLDGDLSKYLAIDLLNDYGITLGTDMPDFEKSKAAADKNIADFNVLKDANGIKTDDAVVDDIDYDKPEE